MNKTLSIEISNQKMFSSKNFPNKMEAMIYNIKLLILDLLGQLEELGLKLIVEQKNIWLLKLLATLIMEFLLIFGL